MSGIMGRKSKRKLPPINIGKETFGQKLTRFRKAKGYTQAELAKKMGLTQGLISDYELNKLRAYHEMVVRFALALKISTDELLGVKKSDSDDEKPNLKILRRLKKIEGFSESQQKFILKTIDTFIKGVEAGK